MNLRHKMWRVRPQNTINCSSSNDPRYLSRNLDGNGYTTAITSDILRVVARRAVKLDFLSSGLVAAFYIA